MIATSDICPMPDIIPVISLSVLLLSLPKYAWSIPSMNVGMISINENNKLKCTKSKVKNGKER